PASTWRASAANSGPRWSIVGAAIARSTRSGTFVGPGIWRKCRPLWYAMTMSFTRGTDFAEGAAPRGRRGGPVRLLHQAPVLTRRHAIVMDMSRHMNRIIEIDPER